MHLYLFFRYQESMPSNPSECTTMRTKQPVVIVNPHNFSVHIHMPGVTPKAVSLLFVDEKQLQCKYINLSLQCVPFEMCLKRRGRNGRRKVDLKQRMKAGSVFQPEAKSFAESLTSEQTECQTKPKG